MEGIGDRLKARAAELGLSGAEVARRAGLTATRYGHYLQDIREPDLGTLVRICRVLGIRPDVLLAYDRADPGLDALMAKRAAVAAYLDVLDAGSLELALLVVQAIAATTGLRSPAPVQADAPAAGRRLRGKVLVMPKEAPGRR
jgi:transcriptional regulator with XRE-family HTH domain